MTKKYARMEGIICGMIVGDALGVTTEFSPVQHPKVVQQQMALEKGSHHTYPMRGDGAFHLPPGNWSDDASMGLCLIEGLLALTDGDKREVPFHHIMNLFYDWWSKGHNNGELKSSVGLGGVISKSLLPWESYREASSAPNVLQHAYRAVNDAGVMDKCDGNGSIMRGAGAAVFARSEEEAMRFGYHQSLITTPGYGSANCSRLLSYLCYQAMTSAIDDPEELKQRLLSPDNFEHFLRLCREQSVFTQASNYTELGVESLPDNFVDLCHSVPGDFLQESLNWRVSCSLYQLNPENASPGYYGSYVMDGMSLALHILHNTHSFEEALEMTARLCGDADSNAAVVGQLAGAIYGVDAIPKSWLDTVNTRRVCPKTSILHPKRDPMPVLSFVRERVVMPLVLSDSPAKAPALLTPEPPPVVKPDSVIETPRGLSVSPEIKRSSRLGQGPTIKQSTPITAAPKKQGYNASLYWAYFAGIAGTLAGAALFIIGLFSLQPPLFIAGAALLAVSIVGLRTCSLFKNRDVSTEAMPTKGMAYS